MNIIIIGSGFAGAACAWWLGRSGDNKITVLEQEDMPGVHASGLNAGLASQFEEDPVVAPLSIEGTGFIRRPPKGFFDRPLIDNSGTLFLIDAESEDIVKNGAGPKTARIVSRKKACEMVPILDNVAFTSALWTSDDGIVDIHAYLWAFINGAKANGVKFVMNRTARTFDLKNNLITSVDNIPADIVVNAAGGWAQVVSNAAGAEDLKIVPYRRHLYCTPAMPEVDPKWPLVWGMTQQYYFRPESGGLLLGPCDEVAVAPKVPKVDPAIRELLAEKLSRYCPSLAGVSIAREWCGLRTFAPDHRPVIKWDRKVKNFFWLAALGGRGMTCAASAGRIAAELILNK